MTTWALIPCTTSKLSHRARALDMYSPSVAFRLMVELAQHRSERILILSAKYGVLHPDTEIEPYDHTLKNLKKVERWGWAGQVLAELKQQIKASDRVVSYLGQDYDEGITFNLQLAGCHIAVPLYGLRQGHRLQELKRLLTLPRP